MGRPYAIPVSAAQTPCGARGCPTKEPAKGLRSLSQTSRPAIFSKVAGERSVHGQLMVERKCT